MVGILWCLTSHYIIHYKYCCTGPLASKKEAHTKLSQKHFRRNKKLGSGYTTFSVEHALPLLRNSVWASTSVSRFLKMMEQQYNSLCFVPGARHHIIWTESGFDESQKRLLGVPLGVMVPAVALRAGGG